MSSSAASSAASSPSPSTGDAESDDCIVPLVLGIFGGFSLMSLCWCWFHCVRKRRLKPSVEHKDSVESSPSPPAGSAKVEGKAAPVPKSNFASSNVIPEMPKTVALCSRDEGAILGGRGNIYFSASTAVMSGAAASGASPFRSAPQGWLPTKKALTIMERERQREEFELRSIRDVSDAVGMSSFAEFSQSVSDSDMPAASYEGDKSRFITGGSIVGGSSEEVSSDEQDGGNGDEQKREEEEEEMEGVDGLERPDIDVADLVMDNNDFYTPHDRDSDDGGKNVRNNKALRQAVVMVAVASAETKAHNRNFSNGSNGVGGGKYGGVPRGNGNHLNSNNGDRKQSSASVFLSMESANDSTFGASASARPGANPVVSCGSKDAGEKGSVGGLDCSYVSHSYNLMDEGNRKRRHSPTTRQMLSHSSSESDSGNECGAPEEGVDRPPRIPSSVSGRQAHYQQQNQGHRYRLSSDAEDGIGLMLPHLLEGEGGRDSTSRNGSGGQGGGPVMYPFLSNAMVDTVGKDGGNGRGLVLSSFCSSIQDSSSGDEAENRSGENRARHKESVGGAGGKAPASSGGRISAAGIGGRRLLLRRRRSSSHSSISTGGGSGTWGMVGGKPAWDVFANGDEASPEPRKTCSTDMPTPPSASTDKATALATVPRTEIGNSSRRIRDSASERQEAFHSHSSSSGVSSSVEFSGDGEEDERFEGGVSGMLNTCAGLTPPPTPGAAAAEAAASAAAAAAEATAAAATATATAALATSAAAAAAAAAAAVKDNAGRGGARGKMLLQADYSTNQSVGTVGWPALVSSGVGHRITSGKNAGRWGSSGSGGPPTQPVFGSGRPCSISGGTVLVPSSPIEVESASTDHWGTAVGGGREAPRGEGTTSAKGGFFDSTKKWFDSVSTVVSGIGQAQGQGLRWPGGDTDENKTGDVEVGEAGNTE